MSQIAPSESGYSTEQYFALVEQGVIERDDRVELLEGVIVSMPPVNPPHATATTQVDYAVRDAIGRQAVVRVQLPLALAPRSAPQPDVAVVPGRISDYRKAHPSTALLVIEIADTSLAQDRLSKSRIYAAAAIPEYWIVNLRDDCVEVYCFPLPEQRRYAEIRTMRRGERLQLTAFPGTSVAVEDLLLEPLADDDPEDPTQG